MNIELMEKYIDDLDLASLVELYENIYKKSLPRAIGVSRKQYEDLIKKAIKTDTMIEDKDIDNLDVLFDPDYDYAPGATTKWDY